MDSILTVVILLLAFFCIWCIFYWHPRRKIWAAARLIPGPKPLPLIGNAMIFWGDARNTLPKLQKIHADFGKIVRVWMGNQLWVILSDPEDIKCVFGNLNLINRDHNLALALKPFFGNGLLSNADDAWKVHRKLIQPMFHFKVLESYVEIFGAKAKILIQKLDEVADGSPFNINKMISLCALDAICDAFVGLKTNMQDIGHREFHEAHYATSELIFRRVIYPWLLLPWLYPLTSDGRKTKKIMKIIDEFNNGIITQKVASYREGDRRVGIETGNGKIITSFLDMLIEASKTKKFVLTEREIFDEVITMTSAGLITSSLTMSTLLLLIAIHPDWQDALFAEMSDIFGDDMSRPATNLDLSKMAVMDRVLRETLRMYPAVTLAPREIKEDVVLPSGYTLPAGSSALVIFNLVHRDPKNYPEPNRFLPDRWLPDSDINRHSYAFLPFGAGLRQCIGQKYSLLQMKSTISQMVRRYKIATDLTMQDLEKLEIGLLSRLCSGGYQLQLKKRESV